MNIINCKNCAYWRNETEDKINDNDFRECRRHSPIVHLNHDSPRWPVTIGSDWCGDFHDKRDIEGAFDSKA